jgi:hypothetical protein
VTLWSDVVYAEGRLVIEKSAQTDLFTGERVVRILRDTMKLD